MFKNLKIASTAFAALFAAGGALAEGAYAIVIGNEDYSRLRDMPAVEGVIDQGAELSRAGFTVVTLRDLDARDIARASLEIEQAIAAADRVLVLLAGHVVSSHGESWLLHSNAGPISNLLGGVPGLSIDALLDMLADKAGRAVVVVGRSPVEPTLNERLTYGFVTDDIPQGVTVISATAPDVPALAQALSIPGVTTDEVVKSLPAGAEAHGFVSSLVPFSDGKRKAVQVSESQLWAVAKRIGTEAGYQQFLKRFPNGKYSSEARAILEKLQKTPADLAREVEGALKLSRNQRRTIQQDLTLLEYDTRGIDGIFGRGTRGAIGDWQKDNGFEITGYLTKEQIDELGIQSANRARELEEEAIQKKLEEERQDAEYWRATGQDGTEESLRLYLRRYPDGLYSDIARQRLDEFEEEKRQQAAAEEAKDWDEAVATHTVKGYRAFLSKYPDGTFADAARTRLDALRAQNVDSELVSAAKAEENRLLSNTITRALIERQLNALGFKPGKIDGKFDEETRKALRNFQRAAGLPVTGYATKATVVRILGGKS